MTQTTIAMLHIHMQTSIISAYFLGGGGGGGGGRGVGPEEGELGEGWGQGMHTTYFTLLTSTKPMQCSVSMLGDRESGASGNALSEGWRVQLCRGKSFISYV